MCLLLNNPRHEPWINPINNDLVSGPVQCSCSRPLAFYCRDRCVLENTNCASLGQCLEMNEVMRHYWRNEVSCYHHNTANTSLMWLWIMHATKLWVSPYSLQSYSATATPLHSSVVLSVAHSKGVCRVSAEQTCKQSLMMFVKFIKYLHLQTSDKCFHTLRIY